MNDINDRNVDIKVILENKIHQIYNQIILNTEPNSEIGWAGGKSGIALFLFFYYKKYNNDEASKLALNLLYECLEDLNNGDFTYSYCNGLAGFGTVLEVLSESEILEIDTNEMLSSFDFYLEKQMILSIEDGNIDFLHGSLGIAFYFFKRKNTTVVMSFILKLFSVAKTENNGVFWETKFNSGEKNEIGINYGFAHGMFSIVSFLNYTISATHFKEHHNFLKEKLNLILCFLLKKQLNSLHINSFPTWETKTDLVEKSRLGWCYGDVIAGIVLLQSSILLKNKELYSNSIQILKKTLARTNIKQEYIYDAGFCHGSSGLSYLYQKIFFLTKENDFLIQSNYWYQVTLDKAKFEDEISGYKTFHTEEGFSTCINMLEGISGIGLTLLAKLDEKNQSWDELFLL